MTWTENPPVVVLLAKQFNPSVLSQMWLSGHGILDKQGTFKPGSIFTENLVQVITDEFVLAVLMEQLQFIPAVEPDRQQMLIEEKLGILVRKLPHVPYRAIGLNFNWHLTPETGTVSAVTRDLFAGRTDGIFAGFSDQNARFGAYLSKDFAPFRMKVDVKPINVELNTGEKEDRIQFGFNFHSDLPLAEDAANEAVARFSQWNAVREEAIKTIKAAGYEQ